MKQPALSIPSTRRASLESSAAEAAAVLNWEAKLSCRYGGRPVALRTASGFPVTVRLNRMGRRFRSHGLSVSRALRITHALHCKPNTYSSLSQRASALRIGVSAEASTSVRTPQAAIVRMSASPNVALHSGDCVLASSSGGVPRRIFRCTASTHAALHKLRRIVASTSVALGSLSFESLRQHAPLSADRSHCTLHHRASLSTDSFSSCRFNESCGSGACTVS